MSRRLRFPGCRLLLLLLLAAWSVVSVAPAARADDSWIPTNTHAAIRMMPGGQVYILGMAGQPTIDAAQIMPLDPGKRLHISVSLNQRNARQLQTYLQELDQPGSANYRRYLTPAQFKARYAPTGAQVRAVAAHLRKCGFTNIQVAPNNLFVSADGNATSVNAAFHTRMLTFDYQGRTYFANATDVMVPRSLNGIVNSVQGLQNITLPHVLSHSGISRQAK